MYANEHKMNINGCKYIVCQNMLANALKQG